MSSRWLSAVAVLFCVGMACAQEQPAEPLPEGDQPAAEEGAEAGDTEEGETGAEEEAETGEAEGNAPLLESVRDKASYAIGLDIGGSFKEKAIDVDLDLVMRGIADALSQAKPLLTAEEIEEAMAVFQKELREKKKERDQQLAATNKEEGTAFLAANKKKKGVKTTKSGLQYRIIKEGEGATPKASDTVTTHYRGTLLDGTEFDSSYSRNEPTSFPVDGVIAGWTEALQLMPVGSKWELFIPSDLAYGDRPPQGSGIGPGATLLFEIELLSIADE